MPVSVFIINEKMLTYLHLHLHKKCYFLILRTLSISIINSSGKLELECTLIVTFPLYSEICVVHFPQGTNQFVHGFFVDIFLGALARSMKKEKLI